MQWDERDFSEQKKLDKKWHLKFAWIPTSILRHKSPYGPVTVWLECYWRRRVPSKHPGPYFYQKNRPAFVWKKTVRAEVPDGVEVIHTRCGEHVINSL